MTSGYSAQLHNTFRPSAENHYFAYIRLFFAPRGAKEDIFSTINCNFSFCSFVSHLS